MNPRIFILGMTLLALAGCGGEPPTLVGTYRSSGKCVDEVLTLTGGDKFMHSYGKVTYEGTWRADKHSITFSPFRAWNPTESADERPEAEGVQASYVKLVTGGAFRIDIGAGCEFIKK